MLEKQGAVAWQEVPAEMWCSHHVEPRMAPCCGDVGNPDATEESRECQTCYMGSRQLLPCPQGETGHAVHVTC